MEVFMKKKGFANTIWMVVFAAIAFIVLGLVVTYGSVITEDEYVGRCVGTYITNTTAATGLMASQATNPVTGSFYGCCATLGASGGNNCSSWYTADYALNASSETLKAQTNISEKQGTMGNVVMAGAIIAILLAAFGGLAMQGRK
jgi:hypothetical protein